MQAVETVAGSMFASGPVAVVEVSTELASTCDSSDERASVGLASDPPEMAAASDAVLSDPKPSCSNSDLERVACRAEACLRIDIIVSWPKRRLCPALRCVRSRRRARRCSGSSRPRLSPRVRLQMRQSVRTAPASFSLRAVQFARFALSQQSVVPRPVCFSRHPLSPSLQNAHSTGPLPFNDRISLNLVCFYSLFDLLFLVFSICHWSRRVFCPSSFLWFVFSVTSPVSIHFVDRGRICRRWSAPE